MQKKVSLREKFAKKEKKKEQGQKTFSYSEFSLYKRCPFAWYQTYILKTIPWTDSIHGIFGTAFHEVFQTYIDTCLTDSAKAADELPVDTMLLEKMKNLYMEAFQKNQQHFTNPLQLSEFWQDGVLIFKWFKARRRIYFNSRDWEIVGIELIINHPILSGLNVYGFIDLVLYNKRTKRYKIVDIKTSTRGWHKNTKADKMKQAQILLYKKFFSEQYEVDVDEIDVEFFIVKRKLLEECDFPQKRIQVFEPASGKVSMKRVERDVLEFVNECYNEDGTYKIKETYPAISGERGNNCTFCALKDNEELCPTSKRLKA